MQSRKIAVSHATGVLAEAVLERLQLSGVTAEQLVLLDREDQLGVRVAYADTYLISEDQHNHDYSSCALLLLLKPDETVESLAREQGCFVLGMVSAEDAPVVHMGSTLAEPAIDYGADCARLPGPDSSSLLDTLICLQRIQPIRRVHLTWLQSASQQGKAGIDELASQTINLLNTREIKARAFPQQIAFNLFTAPADPVVAGEIAQFLDLPPEGIFQNNVFTAVFYGLAVSVVVELESAVAQDEIDAALRALQDVEVKTTVGSMVSDCNQSFSCSITHLTVTEQEPHVVSFWLMADPHRYGLARNYAALAEFLQNSFL